MDVGEINSFATRLYEMCLHNNGANWHSLLHHYDKTDVYLKEGDVTVQAG